MLNVQNFIASNENTEFNWDSYINNEQADEVRREIILSLEQEHIANEYVPVAHKQPKPSRKFLGDTQARG